MNDIIEIYTDGSCLNNPGPGGWAAILRYREVEKILTGASSGETTNNKMELQAVIESLKAIKNLQQKITIYTDSQYVKNGITKWIYAWQKKGWRTSDGKPVKNQQQWQELLILNQQHDVIWQWVKGHSDNEYNNKVDLLAKQAIKNNHV